MNDDDPWLWAHLPPMTPADATRVAPIPSTNNRSIGPVTKGNIPLPSAPAGTRLPLAGVPRESRESWLMSHISDALPIVGSMRGIQAGAGLSRTGHPLMGAALAALSVVPEAGAVAKGIAERGALRVFEHYSDADLSKGLLDPSFMGTGRPGREVARADRVPMSHVYTQGARPEPQFKNLPKYEVHVNGSVYDIADDPDGIAAKVMRDYRAGKFSTDPATMLERRIQKAGHAGFTDSYNSPTIVKLYGKQPVTPAGVPLAVRDSAVARLTGLDDAARVLKQFQAQSGNVNLPRVKAVDAEKAAHMAKLYESLPKHDPAAASAYDALNREVEQQHQAILDAGHTINYVDHDPYKNSNEMIADVRDNKNLNVFKTQGDQQHPYMTPEQNDRFRAVHDWLAHAGEGHSFGPIGEENAYRVHASTLSPEAQQALATETRGQNSWVNFGPHSHLPVTQRPYAEQKAALFPKEFLGDYGDMNTSPFYSRTQRAIETAPFAKGTPQQWLAHLAKNSTQGEREWTGVQDFLASGGRLSSRDAPAKTLTREQILAQMQPIELGEKTLGDNAAVMERRATARDAHSVAVNQWNDNLRSQGTSQVDRANSTGSLLFDRHLSVDDILTKYGLQSNHINRDLAGQVRSSLEAYDATHEAAFAPAAKFTQYTEPGGSNYREKLITLLGDERKPAYRNSQGQIVRESSPYDFHSSHFDEPNILAHLRLKDRELPNGEKVLHIEELQSDWHQKGRANGYTDPARQILREQHAEAVRARDRAYSDYVRAIPSYHDGTLPPEEFQPLLQRYQDRDDEANRLFSELDGNIDDSNRVPNAPFKKTEDWQLLGLKHAIHDAVHGGYDRVAWTPGDLQAARYDLSKEVDRLTYHPKAGELFAYQDGAVVHQGKYDPKALPDVIGKEAAGRLLQTEPNGWGEHELEGEALQIGGEGMKGFYDKLLPNNLTAYLKKLGITPPPIELAHVNVPSGARSFPSFKITPELRRLVLSKGQPLWAGLGAAGLGGGLLGDQSK